MRTIHIAGFLFGLALLVLSGDTKAQAQDCAELGGRVAVANGVLNDSKGKPDQNFNVLRLLDALDAYHKQCDKIKERWELLVKAPAPGVSVAEAKAPACDLNALTAAHQQAHDYWVRHENDAAAWEANIRAFYPYQQCLDRQSPKAPQK